VGLLLVLCVLVLVGTSNADWYADDWDAVERALYPLGLDAILAPHGDQTAVPGVLGIRFLAGIVGMDSYLPFRLLAVISWLAVVCALWIYARRRAGALVATALAAPLAVLGTGSLSLMSAFLVHYNVALLGGVVAFLLVSLGRMWADIGASVALIIGVFSATVALPFALGVLIVLLAGKQRLRRFWVPLPALSLFLVWSARYATSSASSAGEISVDRILAWPWFLIRAMASAFGGLLGIGPVAALVFAGPPCPTRSLFCATGPSAITGTWQYWVTIPLVGGLAVVAWKRRLWRTPLFLGAVVTGVTFWALLAWARQAYLPNMSWFVSVGAVAAALIVIEAAAGWIPSSRPVIALVVVVSVSATALNFAQLLRANDAWGELTELQRARYGALLQGAREASVPRDLYPVIGMAPRARALVEVDRRFGSTATPSSALPRLSPDLRRFVDDQLIQVVLRSRAIPVAEVAGGGYPGSFRATAGYVKRLENGCLRLAPGADGLAGVEVDLRSAGLALAVPRNGSAVRLQLRRFAGDFVFGLTAGYAGGIPLEPGTTKRITLGAPEVGTPEWVARVTGGGPVTICGSGATPQ
jgi:hypothetical protein